MKTVYEAADGTIHPTIHACLEHEKTSIKKEDSNYQKFLDTWNGKDLLKKYSLDTTGVWRVEGEDPNCDLGGPHHCPYLATYTGTLEDVIRKAVNLAGFWQWGAGGRITKLEVTAV